MVFPGHFSTGCGRCRQRKVKCDEGKPTCRRCYIYGKPCPGYTDQFHFRHSSSSASTANTANSASASTVASKSAGGTGSRARQGGAAPARKGSKASATGDVKSKQEADPTKKSSQLITTRPQPKAGETIRVNPELSYEHVALSYFVRRFVSVDGEDSFPGHLTFLPDLLSGHRDQSLIETATLSVAQMAAFNQFGGDKFRVQSYQNYGRALRTLHKTIQSEQDATDDKVIAAILLLCAFKDVSGERSGDPSDHAVGLYHLLEKRGIEQLATRTGVELFLLALVRLQVYSFLHDDDTYCNPGGLTEVLGLFDPLMRAMSLVSQTLSLRHSLLAKTSSLNVVPGQASPTISPVDPDLNTAEESESHDALLLSCFKTLDEFSTWDAEAATYWQNTFLGRSTPTALGEVGHAARYYDPETACTIILVRSSRLILLLSLLEFYQRMQYCTGGTYSMGDGAQWSQYVPALERDTRSTIEDMLSLVPYALSDFDSNGAPVATPNDGAGALIILQSIRLVTYCPYATPQQIQRGQDVLKRINTTIGIRSAVAWRDVAEADMQSIGWQPLSPDLRRVSIGGAMSQPLPHLPGDATAESTT